MGYYTKHDLYTEPPLNGLSEELEEKTGYYWIEAKNGHYDMEEPSKWYQHDEDMIAISKAYPETLFELRGEGEESGDIWRSFYKNGKSKHQSARMVFPDFNEKDLR